MGEFASSLATMLRTLIPPDLSFSYHANLLLFPLASLPFGIPATSSGATNTTMFPLDPQIKDTTSKPRNPSSSGPSSLPPPSHSSGPTSFAFAEPTPTPLSHQSNSRKRDLNKSKRISLDHSVSSFQRSQKSQE